MIAERDSTMTLDTSRILALAAEIRRVDGGNKSGAAELAERLMPFIDTHLATRDAVVISNELLHGHLAPTYGEPDEDGVGYFFTCEDLERFVSACAESIASRKAAVPDDGLRSIKSLAGKWLREAAQLPELSPVALTKKQCAEAFLALAHAKVLYECLWTQDQDDGSWDTACGNKHEFTADGPKENSHSFCPYCGNLLNSAPSDQSMLASQDEVK